MGKLQARLRQLRREVASRGLGQTKPKPLTIYVVNEWVNRIRGRETEGPEPITYDSDLVDDWTKRIARGSTPYLVVGHPGLEKRHQAYNAIQPHVEVDEPGPNAEKSVSERPELRGDESDVINRGSADTYLPEDEPNSVISQNGPITDKIEDEPVWKRMGYDDEFEYADEYEAANLWGHGLGCAPVGFNGLWPPQSEKHLKRAIECGWIPPDGFELGRPYKPGIDTWLEKRQEQYQGWEKSIGESAKN